MTEQEIKDKNPDVILYEEAKQKGLDYYFTGNPCLYNQVAKRDIKTRHCLCFICSAKQKFKEMEYARNNREKEAARRRCWEKKKRTEPHNPVFIKPR